MSNYFFKYQNIIQNIAEDIRTTKIIGFEESVLPSPYIKYGHRSVYIIMLMLHLYGEYTLKYINLQCAM